MPMTTTGTPYANKEATVTNTSKADSTGSSTNDPKSVLKDSDQAHAVAPGSLAPAGQSGDPAVQKLLAERELHRMHSEPDPDHAEQAENARKAMAEIDKKLEELGFTAK